MQASVIDIVLILFGFYFFYGSLFKPDFFWNRGRIMRTRDLLGDQRTQWIYLVLSIIMMGVGIFGAYGGLG